MSVDDRSIERHLSIDSTLSLFCELIQGGQKGSSGDDFKPSIPELTDEQKSYNKQVIRRFFGDIPYSDEAIARQEVISREVLIEVMKARGERPFEVYEIKNHEQIIREKISMGYKIEDESYIAEMVNMVRKALDVVPNPYYISKGGEMIFQFMPVYFNYTAYLVENHSRFKWRYTYGTPEEHWRLYLQDIDRQFNEESAGEEWVHAEPIINLLKDRTGHSFGSYLRALAANSVRETLDIEFLKKTAFFCDPKNNAAVTSCLIFYVVMYYLEKQSPSLDSIFHKDTLPRINHPHIYLSLAPNDVMPPYATYTLEQVQELKDKSGYFGLDIVVKFDFYTHTPTAVSDESWLGFMRGVNVKNKQLVGHNGGIIITECDMIDMSLDKVDSVTYDKSYTYHYQVQWTDNMISINN